MGLSRRALDEAIKYSLERKTFGKPIAAHQAISFKIADMATEIEAARLLTYKSASLVDNGQRNTHVASMAKRFAGDLVQRATYEAIQIFGGAGFNTEYPVEKLYRDARIYALYEGTSEIQKVIISRDILGNPDLVTP